MWVCNIYLKDGIYNDDVFYSWFYVLEEKLFDIVFSVCFLYVSLNF